MKGGALSSVLTKHLLYRRESKALRLLPSMIDDAVFMHHSLNNLIPEIEVP